MKQADRPTRARPGGFLYAAAVLPSCTTRIRNNTGWLVPAHVAGRLRLCRSWPSALDRDSTCWIGDGLPDNLPDRDFSSVEAFNLGLLHAVIQVLRNDSASAAHPLAYALDFN
jgi:hypothetical protein